jgi:curved DNA-binding protein CbpA
MQKKTLYGILEVSEDASAAAIRASYDRLSVRHDPDSPENAGNSEARLQYNLIRDAFLTLANEAKRKAYDQTLARTRHAERSITYEDKPVQQSSLMKSLLVIGIAVAVGGYLYYDRQQTAQELERVAAEKKKIEEEVKKRQAEDDQRAAQIAANDAAEQKRLRRNLELEQARRDADQSRQSVYSEVRARHEAEMQRRREEMERQREAYEATRRVEREKAYARQLEYENSHNRPLAFR